MKTTTTTNKRTMTEREREEILKVHRTCTADALRIDDDEPEGNRVPDTRIRLRVDISVSVSD